MGIILAKFRKEKTTLEILEDLETKIKDIESYSISTQERQKRFVGNFLVFSIGLYVLASIVFYFVFFPTKWSKRIMYSTPLLIFPILIILLKRLVAWFFQRKLNRNAEKLKSLRAEKRKTLEQVMDKETYKVAVEILNRFGDRDTRVSSSQSAAALLRSPNSSMNQSGMMTPQKMPQPMKPATPQTQPRQSIQLAAPIARTPINARSMPHALTTPQPSQYAGASSPIYGIQSAGLIHRRPHDQHTPFPIVNQNQKGMFEKIVDFLINDGPSNRYGMICKECHGHNGMVSQEEYEYSAFKCAFCKALNPAKKLRPIAPRLPMPMPKETSDTNNKTTTEKPQQLSGPSSTAPVQDKESGSESELVSSTETETLNSQETEPKADAIVINAEATTKTAIKQLSNATDEIVEANNSQAVKSNDDKKNE